MTTATKIEWTGITWNPVTGCDRISPGCDNCYALSLAARLKGMEAGRLKDNPAAVLKYQTDGDPRTSGPGFGVATHPHTLLDPIVRWPQRSRKLVFVNSMSDLWHARVPLSFAARVFATMALTPQHTYQVLTKRPERAQKLFAGNRFRDAVYDALHDLRRAGQVVWTERQASLLRWPAARLKWPLPNVWLGTSIETDEYSSRADTLRAIPAAVRFLSFEPLLGPLPSLQLAGIDWVIVGGESGARARPMQPDWARHLRDRCQSAAVPFFFKQWGEWSPTGRVGIGTVERQTLLVGDPDPDGFREEIRRVGKPRAGRELDGRTWNQFPHVEVTTR